MADVEAKERKILVAVDEGEESKYALSWFIENVISQNSKDTLILLYAKPNRVVYPALDGTGRRGHSEGYLFSSDIIASMEKYSKGVADCVIEKAKKLCSGLPNVKIETRVENGDAREVICEMAEKVGADLVIL
ncbi:hypothetical protein HHK36_022911 [Tetracentron sinense]|uniref:UspA domain-containing protein n=1 Tax=Tetracentron sinense TaxID=13715 RepID=A0A835D786_TETSI|nr:hypothetical protein HHK36_022911 [Tetracentron sinense]